MRHVVKRDRDDLLGRFGIAQLNGLQPGLTDFNAPRGLCICHDRESLKIRRSEVESLMTGRWFRELRPSF